MQDEERCSDWDFGFYDHDPKSDPLYSPETKAFLERQERTQDVFPDCDLYFEDDHARNISLPVKIKKSSGISIQEFQKKTQNFFTSKDPAKNLEDLREMDRLFDQAVAYSKKKREERGHTGKRRSRFTSPDPSSDEEQDPPSVPETPPEIPDYDPNYVDLWEQNFKNPRIEVLVNLGKQEERPKKRTKEERPKKHTKEERPKSPSKKIGVVKIPEIPQDTSEEYPTAEILLNMSSPKTEYERKKAFQEINQRFGEFVDTIPERLKEEGIPLADIRERMETYFGIPGLTNNGVGKMSGFVEHFSRKKKRIDGGWMIFYYKKS